MATAEVQEIRATSYVGFDSITQQIEHKLLKRGFQFNVIVVGTSHPPLTFYYPPSSVPCVERVRAISNPLVSGY